MERLPRELLENVFVRTSIQELLMVLPHVCRHWRDVVCGMTVDTLEFGWARVWLNAVPGEADRSAAVCAMLARVGGARHVSISLDGKGDAVLKPLAALHSVTSLSINHCQRLTGRGLASLRGLSGTLTSLSAGAALYLCSM